MILNQSRNLCAQDWREQPDNKANGASSEDFNAYWKQVTQTPDLLTKWENMSKEYMSAAAKSGPTSTGDMDDAQRNDDAQRI